MAECQEFFIFYYLCGVISRLSKLANGKIEFMAKILIIEDESAIRRVLTKILVEESKEYEVEEAADGVEGVEKLKKRTTT